MVWRRYELSERRRSLIELLLPNKPRDVARVDHRRHLLAAPRRLALGRDTRVPSYFDYLLQPVRLLAQSRG